MELRSVQLIGVRPEVDFHALEADENYDDPSQATDLNERRSAPYLTTPYSYLATTKPSQYFEDKSKRPRRVSCRAARVPRRLSANEEEAGVVRAPMDDRRPRHAGTRGSWQLLIRSQAARPTRSGSTTRSS